MVTAGGAGVAIATADAHAWVSAVSVDVVSTVGAGDSFVAGFAYTWQDSGMKEDLSAIVQAVRSGVASAAASCEQVLAGGVVRARYSELLSRVPDADIATGVAS